MPDKYLYLTPVAFDKSSSLMSVLVPFEVTGQKRNRIRRCTPGLKTLRMNSELEFFHDDVESDIIFVKSLSLVSDLVQNFDVSSQKMTQYFFRNDEPSSVSRKNSRRREDIGQRRQRLEN